MSQQYELTSFDLKDKVVFSNASVTGVADILKPIKGSSQVLYGCAAKFEEHSISPQPKPTCFDYGLAVWQYGSQSYTPPSYLPKIFQANVFVQTH